MTGNVPQPLANAPIPLLAATDCQMSFGERAALEGILAQAKPRLAIEVGSAAGGSLRRIARYARRVDSFDLIPPTAEIVDLPNVHVHTGDSRLLLPGWLHELQRPVDFVLVDGDHTAEGVYHDLRALLDARACRRTILLVHDTANPTVREGLDSLHLDDHQRVVHHDLDMVRGYTFAEGPFTGQTWGGLGLLVTGDPAADGYGAHPAQTLYQTTTAPRGEGDSR